MKQRQTKDQLQAELAIVQQKRDKTEVEYRKCVPYSDKAKATIKKFFILCKRADVLTLKVNGLIPS